MATKKTLKKYLSELKNALGDKVGAELFTVLEQGLAKMPDGPLKDKYLDVSKDQFKVPEGLSDNDYAVYSDGACRGNPGPGAYGAIVQNANSEVLTELAEFFSETTNNRMEMLGALKGLEYVLKNAKNPKNAHVFLISDSQYVLKGLQEWIHSWKKRGWKKADKKAPENLDLWMQLDEVVQGLGHMSYHWVKGHKGHPQNEYCDQLANKYLDENS